MENKQLITEFLEATVGVVVITQTMVVSLTEAMSDDRPKNGIFLVDLSCELVVLGTGFMKLGAGQLRQS